MIYRWYKTRFKRNGVPIVLLQWRETVPCDGSATPPLPDGDLAAVHTWDLDIMLPGTADDED